MSRTVLWRLSVGGIVLSAAAVLASCGGGSGGLSGQIDVEGSSTVQPITQAAAEVFAQENRSVRISVGGAGTGDGFEAFCAGNTHISNASRPIEAEELRACKKSGVEFIELPVAYDGISVAVNKQNTFARDITSEELERIWEPGSEVASWQQVRSGWPDQEITLYGPGTESGTFDFFTEKINGEEGASRTKYQASEDDNVLVQGVSNDRSALGYFGFSYYENNRDTLRALEVDGVEPDTRSIRSNEYPLSRPLFIYVSADALDKNEAVREFVGFYLSASTLDRIVERARYVTLPSELERETRAQFEDRTTGTVMNAEGQPRGGDLTAALRQSR